MNEKLLDGKITLYSEDCLKVLATLPENSIDSCVTDPPYHLTSIVERFGAENAAPAKYGKDGVFQRSSKGFMNKRWDGGRISSNIKTWKLVYRALKPGAHLVAFGGTRTYHRMVCAIEDAGFEIRDTIMWVYGTGFPKSHDMSKNIDQQLGAKRKKTHSKVELGFNTGRGVSDNRRPYMDDPDHMTDSDEPVTDEAKQWKGWGTGLKPACEPIVLARKPLSEKTNAANVLKWGTGALNIDDCRIATEDDLTQVTKGWASAKHEGYRRPWMKDKEKEVFGSTNGRWPANLIHDGSEEIFSRFFYTAKANDSDRLGAKHPTIKPVDLMQYLVRLVTPKGGVCLDLFAGTGTTGEAAVREGMQAILIEKEHDYQCDIRFRMECFYMTPEQRKYTAKIRDKIDKQREEEQLLHKQR